MVCVTRRVLGKRIFPISSRSAAWRVEKRLPLSLQLAGDVRWVVHGDDSRFLAFEDQLRHIEETLRNHCSLAVRCVLGPESDDLRKIPVLGRQVVWTEGGIVFEVDPEHACKVIHDLGPLHLHMV